MSIHANRDRTLASLPGIDHRTLASSDDGLSHLSLWQQWLAPGAATPPHRHDCEEVVVVLSGSGELRQGETSRPFGADSTLVLPPHEVHQILNTGDQPLHLIAAFAATPVDTALPDGTPLALPWRS